MKLRSFFFFLSTIICPVVTAQAQAIDNMTSARSINNSAYFRLHYENDFFTATDQYYSQGINLEYVAPGLRKITPCFLLLHLPVAIRKFGLLVEHDAYTPTSIRNTEIIKGDRPFAATLTLKTFLITTDTIRKLRIASSFTAGAMGKVAGGQWMQTSIHKWLKNIEPLGWEHQVTNDVVLNYQTTIEKQLVHMPHNFLMSTYAKLNAGTLFTNASAGTVMMAGLFDCPFNADAKSKNAVTVYIYLQPQVNFIAYDATLQGGLLNHDSPNVISTSSISRVTGEASAGLCLGFKSIHVEYFQAIKTKEFSTGTYHRWGGVRMAVSF